MWESGNSRYTIDIQKYHKYYSNMLQEDRLKYIIGTEQRKVRVDEEVERMTAKEMRETVRKTRQSKWTVQD
jgi:hypothetical protein